ncbi:MAG: hypothetical protein QXV69_02260 [Sulfolobaceae archaeon]
MNEVELLLFLIGTVLFPYGVYEIFKSNGDRLIKWLLLVISILLFVIESIIVFLL